MWLGDHACVDDGLGYGLSDVMPSWNASIAVPMWIVPSVIIMETKRLSIVERLCRLRRPARCNSRSSCFAVVL